MSRGTLSDNLTVSESSWLVTELQRLEKAAVWGGDPAPLNDALAAIVRAAAAAVAADLGALYQQGFTNCVQKDVALQAALAAHEPMTPLRAARQAGFRRGYGKQIDF